MTDLDSLIHHLPAGDVQYQKRDDGYAVCIFEPGAVAVRMTVATGMDKGVAAWLKERLIMARAAA